MSTCLYEHMQNMDTVKVAKVHSNHIAPHVKCVSLLFRRLQMSHLMWSQRTSDGSFALPFALMLVVPS